MFLANMFFLQVGTGSPIAARQNPLVYEILLLALVAMAVVYFVSKTFSKKILAKLRRHDTKANVLKATSIFGFSAEEFNFLFSIVKAYRIGDVNFLLRNRDRLDKAFKWAFSGISKRSDKQKALENLFSVRQKIGAVKRREFMLTSTQQFNDEQPLTLVAPDKRQYRSFVVSCEPQGVYVAIPYDEVGNIVDIPNLSEIGLFFQHGVVSYICETRVLQTLAYREKKTLLLNHTNRITPLSVRKFRRTEISSQVSLEKVVPSFASDGSKRIVYEKTGEKTDNCSMKDISVGGCCVLSAEKNFRLGDFVVAEIAIGKETKDEIFGRIIRVKESEDENSLHICFSQVPVETRNRIYSVVYGYDDANL